MCLNRMMMHGTSNLESLPLWPSRPCHTSGSLSLACLKFSSRPVHVIFVVHKVTLEQDCLRVFLCAPVGIIARVLHARAAVTRRTSGRSFTQRSAVLLLGSIALSNATGVNCRSVRPSNSHVSLAVRAGVATLCHPLLMLHCCMDEVTCCPFEFMKESFRPFFTTNGLGFVRQGSLMASVVVARATYVRGRLLLSFFLAKDRNASVLTHYSGRVTQICVFNTVKLGTSASSP